MARPECVDGGREQHRPGVQAADRRRERAGPHPIAVRYLDGQRPVQGEHQRQVGAGQAAMHAGHRWHSVPEHLRDRRGRRSASGAATRADWCPEPSRAHVDYGRPSLPTSVRSGKTRSDLAPMEPSAPARLSLQVLFARRDPGGRSAGALEVVRNLVGTRRWRRPSTDGQTAEGRGRGPGIAVAVLTRILGRGQPHRRGAAQGNRRRRTVAGRDRHRAGLGELAMDRQLLPAAGRRGRPGRAAPESHPGDLGGGRPAGDLLLRRRPGTQARIRGRRPAGPQARGGADRGRGRRDDRPGAGLLRHCRQHRPEGLGDSRPRPTSPSRWPFSR